ncbi:leucine carboxyl methyltransferase [Schizosaccharomyces cryophilus OY26]|uniref:tRNA wybutosine-synthesizing protein 4 n=1 Tax=Schizosaccharomyces cryophilus (strain OY26 / ATCC MYA-4695 / CBS 11777 / NBRC 106824 / NRRL Y48691) TaxID=653667 RepID=S9XJG7_SCHCR|nr:leucine carboxyl methyltransferase [Schizosaccharomyces cryophilus OY26]EPY53831.1 leucine carboxyl methyltransferase [Schizosaccharomyces cryophilus OY26]
MVPKQENTFRSKDKEVRKTNDSSILSKASVEKCGYPGFDKNHSYYRPFISKTPRRSPSVNRGYWTRCIAIRFAIEQFLEKKRGKPKAIVNLGAGYDPLALQLLNSLSDRSTEDIAFYDVDYPESIENRVSMILSDDFLRGIVYRNSFEIDELEEIHTNNYHTVGCNLKDLDLLQKKLEECGLDFKTSSILFISEVAAVYMPVNASDSLLQWMSQFSDAHSCFLEQIAPAGFNHPFAKVMIRHFKEWGTPLHGLAAYQNLEALKYRWVNLGWEHVEVFDVCTFWNFLLSERYRVECEQTEPFDEWEEFYFFLQHYSIQHASSTLDQMYNLVEHPNPFMQYYRYQINGHECSPVQCESILSNKRIELTMVAAEIKQALPSCRSAGVGASENGIIIQGGLSTSGRTNSAFLITEKQNVIDISSSEISPRMNLSIVPVNNGDYMLIGGRESPVRAFDTCYLYSKGAWKQTASLPYPAFRVSTTKVHYGNENFILLQAGKPHGGWLIWSEQTNEWSQVCCTEPSLTKSWGSSIHYSSQLQYGFITGGMNQHNLPIDDVWEWKLEKRNNRFELHFSPWNLSEGSKVLLARVNSNLAILDNDNAMPLIIGGAGLYKTIKWEEEVIIINMVGQQIENVPLEEPESRPVLVSCQCCCLRDLLFVFGGGCICFSFGSFINENVHCLKVSEK